VPYLFEISTITSNHDFGVYVENDQYMYPPLQQLSRDSLDKNGIYLMDVGNKFILFFCDEADSDDI